MAKTRTSTRKTKGSGRGSAEAIEKRRAARQLNSLFSDGVKRGTGLDGRTEKRRVRLLKELKEGRRGQPLKAIEVLQHTQELLDIGETLGSIRKSGVKAPRVQLADTEQDVIERTQRAYGFRPEAWKVLGIQLGGVEDDDDEERPRRRANNHKRAKK